MKKTLIISALVAGSLSAYSQGTVFFTDRDSDMTIHIFAPQVATTGMEVTGDQGLANGAATGGVSSDLYLNNAADGSYGGTSVAGSGSAGTTTTGGTTVYTGGAIGNTLTGFATPAGSFSYNNGSDYTVQLYAAPGLNVAASALSPVTQYVSTLATSSATGGTFKPVNPTPDNGIPNTSGGSATIMLVAWYNGGTSLTFAQAFAAGDPVGESPTDNVNPLGGTGGPPAATTADMLGLESFSLYIPTPSPEPSTIALGVIGASTLLFRRRK